MQRKSHLFIRCINTRIKLYINLNTRNKYMYLCRKEKVFSSSKLRECFIKNHYFTQVENLHALKNISTMKYNKYLKTKPT